MTFEECVNRLPDELASIGYKSTFNNTSINFFLDDSCNDCLVRIVNPQNKTDKCLCFAEHIHETDWNTCYYKDFNDTSYETIMTAARNMVAQYKKYNIELKIDELSKDFV